MKKLLALVAVLALLLVCTSAVQAMEWWERVSLEAGPMLIIGNSDGDESTELRYGAKARALVRLGDVEVADDFSLRFEVFPYFSYDWGKTKFHGQNAGSLEFYSVGGGAAVSFLRYVSIRADVGFYFPRLSLSGARTTMNGGEGSYLDWLKWIKCHDYSVTATDLYAFERNVEGGVGGTITLNLHYDITPHWRVGFDFGYMIRMLTRHDRAYLTPGWGGCERCYIEKKETQNYGGWMFWLGVAYTF